MKRKLAGLLLGAAVLLTGGQATAVDEPEALRLLVESLGRVDLMERHPDEKPYGISGSKVREQLSGGERPDARILRPEIADILIEACAFRSSVSSRALSWLARPPA